MRSRTLKRIYDEVSNGFNSVLTKIMQRIRSLKIKAYQRRGITHSGIRYNRRANLHGYARWYCITYLTIAARAERERLRAFSTIHRYGTRPTVLAYTASKKLQVPRQPLTFDTDSFPILVDNCCSASITNDLQDFIAPPRTTSTTIEGYSGKSTATKIGTVKWKIKDDKGKVHIILLPGTYYAPAGKYKLLCPQHWAQTANDNTPQPDGTYCVTYASKIVMFWAQRQYKKTIPLVSNNVGILYSASGIRKYTRTCTQYEKAMPLLCMPTTIEAQEESEAEPTRTHIITPPSSRENSQERTQVHEGENGVDNEEAALDNSPNNDHYAVAVFLEKPIENRGRLKARKAGSR